MCLILLSYRVHPEFPLIVAANRDEFYQRPTAIASIWDEAGVLAGRDLQAQGTWLGVTNAGKFAAVTNYRGDSVLTPANTSRGSIVAEYLRSHQDACTWSAELSKQANAYLGYNLLVYDGKYLVYTSNRGEERLQRLNPGIYGLSNKSLNTPWPKVRRGCEALQSLVSKNDVPTEQLLTLMMDQEKAPDDLLPDTGIPKEWERLLSSMFICAENYGTRCTTVVKFSIHERIEFTERSYSDCGVQSITNRFEFSVGE